MKHKYDIQDEQDSIRKSILRIAEELKKTPTQKEYKIHRNKNELSLEQITYRFGRWSDAVNFAGLEPNDFQNPPRNNIITEQELIDEFIRVANIEKKIPGQQFFRANSKFSWTPYKTKWGSWKEAVVYISLKYPERFNFDIVVNDTKVKKEKRKLLGHDCALIYEPTNEYETVVLFGIFAKELGYKILKIQTDFPDGILEKCGQEILVEFEYLSSNYIQHGHPLDFDGICICWRKDCELTGIDIISLEEYIRKKGHNTTYIAYPAGYVT